MNKHITFDNLSERASFWSATSRDIDELLDLYQRFYAEAVYKDFLEFDPVRAHRTISIGIRDGSRPHIVAVVEGSIVGFLSYFLDDSFSTKPCLVLLELYVEPEHRRSALGRALVGMAILEGRKAGAGAFHAPVASGMEAARSLCNLFSKAGFTQLGYVMRRPL